MQTGTKPIVFYDGTCGLCHGVVRWVLRRDNGGIFAFAPLQGATFEAMVSASERSTLPDSFVVRDETGQLHTRADAVLFLLRRLGRSRLASVLNIMPRGLRDIGYAFVAKVRYRIFGRKTELCPLVPPELRSRFLE